LPGNKIIPGAEPCGLHENAELRQPSTAIRERFVPSTVAEALCAFNIFTEKKHREELDYMHNDPFKRRLVTSPDQWP
jgi:hypothetical protein